ncbi:MAG: YidC/Oxa1 family insertase periplasmic-domain containing protein [Planctomycetota bacterium]
MGNRRTFALILAFLTFFLVWEIGTNWFAEKMGWETRPIPQERAEDETAQTTTRPAGDDSASSTSTTRPSDDPASVDGLRVEGGTPQTLILGGAVDDPSAYPMRVTVNTVGAGIEEVLLKRYRATLDEPDRYRFEVPYEQDVQATRPMGTRTVTIDGQELDLSGVAWRIDPEKTDERQTRLFVNVFDGDRHVAQILKTIRLFAIDEPLENGVTNHGGYELLVRQTVRNVSDRSFDVATTINGPTTPPRELEAGYDRTVLRGQLNESGNVRYEAEQVEAFDDDEPTRRYLLADEDLAWIGSGTIYFNAIARPEKRDQFRRFVAEAVNPDSPKPERLVAIRMETHEEQVAAGDKFAVPLRVFLGPKKRDLLEGNYYSAGGIRYDSTLISPFGCTWCVFQPVVDILVLLLSFFHALFGDWGLAIICLVILVRTALHPITKRSQKNLMKMSKLAPKIQAAKEKYGDDKEKMAQAMAELAPEQTQALLLGCLPMLLQTPIWIALYSTLQATFALRHEPFLYGWTWIDDLSKPDHLIEFEQRIELIFGIGISGLNLLPLLMGLVFYIQMKLQPTPTATMTDEQKAQQKLIQVMMVTVFPIFLYSMPSGLNLYILTSTTIGIIETKLIRRNIRLEDEALEKAEAEGKPVPEKPKGPIGRRLDEFKKTVASRVAEAQKQAQAMQAAQKNQKGRKR